MLSFSAAGRGIRASMRKSLEVDTTRSVKHWHNGTNRLSLVPSSRARRYCSQRSPVHILSRPRELATHTANSGVETEVDSFCTYFSHV